MKRTVTLILVAVIAAALGAGIAWWMQQREQIGSFWHDGLVPLEPGSGGAGWQREQHSQAMLVGNAASPVHSANGQALLAGMPLSKQPGKRHSVAIAPTLGSGGGQRGAIR